MRIRDSINDVSVDYVILYLTEIEATHMASYLNDLLENRDLHHVHMSSEDYQQEITLTVVREDQLDQFDEGSRELWLTGKLTPKQRG